MTRGNTLDGTCKITGYVPNMGNVICTGVISSAEISSEVDTFECMSIFGTTRELVHGRRRISAVFRIEAMEMVIDFDGNNSNAYVFLLSNIRDQVSDNIF